MEMLLETLIFDATLPLLFLCSHLKLFSLSLSLSLSFSLSPSRSRSHSLALSLSVTSLRHGDIGIQGERNPRSTELSS